MIPSHIRDLLPKVTKPSRYTGGEVNAHRKECSSGGVRIALAFPDVYEVGMSHLGLKILYQILNDQPDICAERTFAPWPDMGDLMQGSGVQLYGLESYSPLTDFDAIGFTLQYELSYTNILYMLELSSIPLRASDRDEEHPIVLAGGPTAYNVEPMAEFLDCVALGEGEEVILEIASALKKAKEAKLTRGEKLAKLAEIPGVYVPSLAEPRYGEDESFLGMRSSLPLPIVKRVLTHLGPSSIPIAPPVPYTEVVHDRVMLEVFRGCTRGCRFCQAGMIYRPVREMPLEDVMEAASLALKSTGYEEVALTSLSTMDYSAIAELLPSLVDKLSCEGANVSLPSLRVDSFSVQMAAEVTKTRKSGLTLAPEAGSQRLRDVINKQVTEDDLLTALKGARDLGFRSVKLYFMLGLPTETYEDLDEMIRLVEKASRILPVTVSVSSFVPKPHTPFQWEPQLSIYELKRRQFYLRDGLRRYKRVKFNYHDAPVSFLEAAFSRGDRRLGSVLLKAYHLGCKFDGWSEHFKFEQWMEAFMSCGVDPTYYANRQRQTDEPLPWEHLSPGVSKEYLIAELKSAHEGSLTGDCSGGACPSCGVCPSLGVKPTTVRRREI